MVAILIVAHEPLASALLSAARHVYSRDPCAASGQMAALDVAPGADPEATHAKARALLAGLDRGQGVLVLTDLAGATPGNVAARLADPGRVAVVAGVSMPMLLRSLCYGERPLADVVQKALAGGTSGIQQMPGAATGTTSPGPG